METGKRKRHKPGKGERELAKRANAPALVIVAPAPAPVSVVPRVPVSIQRSAKDDGDAKASGPKTSRLETTAFAFAVDYNDCFETPLAAYRDLQPALSIMASGKANPTIYDPYFCMGKMHAHLNQLGFDDVINRNADFYEDVRLNRVPAHDVLVSNPPYSSDHKQKLLHYLLNSKTTRPFCLLLPAYTATKFYWRREFVEAMHNKYSGFSFLYLMPPQSYAYDHPDGTGKETPPFYSAWFIGGNFNADAVEMALITSNPELAVLKSVDAMIERKYVTDSAKRPKPSVRRKSNHQVGSAGKGRF